MLELILLVLFAGIFIIPTVARWIVYKQAGEPGWGSIIPIYSTYLQLRMGENPWWYLLLFFVPFVNIYIMFRIKVDIAKKFGKGTLYGIGFALFPFIFWPLLAFGDVEYNAN